MSSLSQLYSLLFRKGDTNYHIGNSRFRYFVCQYKQRYQAASREERQSVVREIVEAWRSQGESSAPLQVQLCGYTASPHKPLSALDLGDNLQILLGASLLGQTLMARTGACGMMLGMR